MAPRRPLEAHFCNFWAQLAKWLPRSLWMLIFAISGLSWPNGSQEASGASFLQFLGSAGQMAPRTPLEAHFCNFWAQLAKWLPGGLWRLIFAISGLSWPNASQDASGELILAISGFSWPNGSQ